VVKLVKRLHSSVEHLQTGRVEMEHIVLSVTALLENSEIFVAGNGISCTLKLFEV
jgi:hypothetical protein